MPRITLAYAWTDESGKTHKPDATLDVTQQAAAELVEMGLARPADDTTTSTSKER